MHHGEDDMEGYDWTDGEDHEGEMAVAQLHRIREMADMLLDMIGENDELEGWVQFKLSRAYNDLTDMFAYVEWEADKAGHWDGESEMEDYEDESDEDYEEELEDYEDKFEDFEGEEESDLDEGEKPSLWANIRARRKAGKPRLKPGQKGYPKTLDIESKEVKEAIRSLVQKQIKG